MEKKKRLCFVQKRLAIYAAGLEQTDQQARLWSVTWHCLTDVWTCEICVIFLKASLWCRAVGAVGAVATRQRGPGFNTQEAGGITGGSEHTLPVLWLPLAVWSMCFRVHIRSVHLTKCTGAPSCTLFHWSNANNTFYELFCQFFFFNFSAVKVM